MTGQHWEDPQADPAPATSSAAPEELAVDVVVAGGGVGGLMAAYRAQRSGARVLLLGGSGPASSRVSSINTALGYCAEDTPARLFDDIYRAGGYVNDPALVAALAHRIGPEILHLDALGVPFHRSGDALARRQAAGSTWTRAVYTLGMIGVDIARVLKQALETSSGPPVIHIKGGQLLELYTNEGRIEGALAYGTREGRWIRASAPGVVLATGGCGQLFGRTTNPRGSKGTGYAVALEAGAELVGMEFISFEPFVTSAPPGATGHDLPTTVLREGARIRNGLGDEFLDTASAPTKDIICRAMLREVLEGRGSPSGSVYYDVREMEPEIVARYVQIEAPLRQLRLNSRDGLLEVMPAQHYMMGGVRIDAEAATSVPGLYAVAEVSGGAHGAHRLAAGGGMEIVSGGAIAGDSAAAYALANPGGPVRRGSHARPELLGLRPSPFARAGLDKISEALDRGCGILRDGETLAASVGAIERVLEEASAEEGEAFLMRSARTALVIATSAVARQECRGDHFRTDHPFRDDRHWLGNLVTTLDGDGNTVSRYEPVARARKAAMAMAQA